MSGYDLLRLSNIKSLGFDASNNSEMEEENHLSTKKGIKRYVLKKNPERYLKVTDSKNDKLIAK